MVKFEDKFMEVQASMIALAIFVLSKKAESTFRFSFFESSLSVKIW